MKINTLLILVMVTFLLMGTAHQAQAQENELKFIITSAVISDPSFTNYKELSNYIANKLGKKSVFISGLTYTQADNLFVQGNADIGFLCNAHYARRKEEVKFEPIAVPLLIGYEKPKFQVYIIVHKDSRIESIEGLKGKTVDLSDPLSTTTIYAADMLLKKNETLKSFFSKVVYSGSHEMTVELVANNIVDGGFIDGHIWDYLNKTHSDSAVKTKVIHKSPDFTLPPVVVSRTITKGLKTKIKQILLTIHENQEGKTILKKLNIERFVPITEKDYQDVFELYNKVRKHL